MTTTRLDAAVLDAVQRQSLVAVRSLGKAGAIAGAFDTVRHVPAFKSRWCAATGILPDYARDPNQFIDGLLALVDRHSPRVLMVAHDGTIEALRRRRSEVEQKVAIALAPEDALALAVSKARTLSLAETLGVDVPRGVLLDDLTGLRDALSEVGVPAVIKPLTSWVERGDMRQRLVSQIVIDESEARAVAERILDAGTSMLLQQWLPGAREAVWLLYADGRFWARFVQVAHRMFPLLGGASVVRESIPPPRDVVDAAERLVATAGLTGYSEVEFRRDVEGRPRLMEINPRLSASIEVAVRAGIDFPFLVYSWAAGLPLRSVPNYRYGVRMRWLSGDMLWLVKTLQSQGRPDAKPAPRAIRDFLTDCFRPTGYDYLTLSDLRPAVVATLRFTATMARTARVRTDGSPAARP